MMVIMMKARIRPLLRELKEEEDWQVPVVS